MRIFCLLLCCLLAAPALANPVAQARADHGQAEQMHGQAVARQAQARAAHEAVVRQIQARKAQAKRNVLGVRDPVLDELLKQGHDLAQTVAQADRAVAAANAQRVARRAALLQALDGALATTTSAFSRSTGVEKKQLFARLQTLSAERARLQAAGHQTQRPQTVRLPAVADGASADELRELADEASDNAERVRKQLSALEQRLSALTMRRRLLRVERTLDGDLTLFGDDERNRQVARAGRVQAADASGRATGDGRNEGVVAEADVAPGQGAPPNAVGGGMPRGPEEPEMPASPDPQPEPQPDADPNFNAGDSDGDGVDDDGLTDMAELEPLPAPPPEATVPENAGGDVAQGNAVVFEASLDPSLLTDDVDSLGPAAVAEQLRALRKKQAQLRKAADELARRRAALQEKANTLDNE